MAGACEEEEREEGREERGEGKDLLVGDQLDEEAVRVL